MAAFAGQPSLLSGMRAKRTIRLVHGAMTPSLRDFHDLKNQAKTFITNIMLKRSWMTIAEITRGDMKIKVDVTPEDLIKIINGVSNTEDICIQVNHETLTLSKAKKSKGWRTSLGLLITGFLNKIDYWYCNIFGTFNT